MKSGDRVTVTGPAGSGLIGKAGTVVEVSPAQSVYPDANKVAKRQRYADDDMIARVRLDGDPERTEGDGVRRVRCRNMEAKHLLAIA